MRLALLAGGIASGKSTVSSHLKERGVPVIDLDVLSREVTKPGSACVAAIAAEFGPDVTDESGALLRRELARVAFATPEATRRLEEVELPFILDALEERLEDLRSAPTVVVEVPLLDRVESLIGRADDVIAVTADPELRVARAVSRGMDEADARRRLAHQPEDDYLKSHATILWNNEGTPEELRALADAWLESLPEATAR